MRTKSLLLLSAIVIAASACFAPAAAAGAEPGPGAMQTAFLSAPGSAARGHAAVQLKNTFGEYRDPRVLKVISLIERKTDNQKVLAQIRHTLTGMGEERLRMVTSLSERIRAGGREAESDVAFLLLTALIIFS